MNVHSKGSQSFVPRNFQGTNTSPVARHLLNARRKVLSCAVLIVLGFRLLARALDDVGKIADCVHISWMNFVHSAAFGLPGS